MTKIPSHHELGASHHEIETSSDRSFGLVFAAAFALLAGYLGWHRNAWWPASLALSAAFLILALTRPVLLAPLNWAWTRLGLLLGMIVAPIVMGLVYYVVITPMAFIARWLGKDFLRLRRDPATATYWLPRRDQQPTAESLRDQF